MRSPSRPGLEILTDAAAVEELSSEWNELVDRSRCNRAFSSATWYLNETACLGGSPFVVIARRNDALVAILPLVVASDGSGPHLMFSGYLADYYDLIAAPDEVEVEAEVVAHALACYAGDRIVLHNLRRDASCLRALASLGADDRHFCVTDRCPYIALEGDHDQLVQSKTRNFRRSLLRARAAVDCGEIAIRELVPGASRGNELAEVFLRLQLGRFPDGLFTIPSAAEFVRRALGPLFEQRRMRVWVVEHAGAIVAMSVFAVGPDSLGGWGTGFDDAAARWSPGKLLIDESLRRSYAAGLSEYDLLRGEEPYKLQWATHTRELGLIELHRGDDGRFAPVPADDEPCADDDPATPRR